MSELARVDADRLPVRDEGSQVMALFGKALERDGGGVEALGKLVQLYEQVQRRNAELEFSRSLVEFQQSCPPIPRTSKATVPTKSGGSFSYTYADLEQIVETVRPHLSDRGFSFTFDADVDGTKLKCTCTLRHANGHSITSTFTCSTDSPTSAMSEQQKVGAAMTFAKRQTLIAVLGLAMTDPDPDGGADPATLSEGHVRNLEALIAEVGADKKKLCSYFGVNDVSDIRLNRFAEAVNMLERKRKKVSDK